MKLLNFSCFLKLLINLKYRLQTGMRGAFRKPQGTTRLLSSNPFAEPSSSSLVAKRYFVRERSKECKLLILLFSK